MFIVKGIPLKESFIEINIKFHINKLLKTILFPFLNTIIIMTKLKLKNAPWLLSSIFHNI